MLEELIKSSTGLIWTIAKRFYGVDKNDLYQAGVLGVVKAYQNYVDDEKVNLVLMLIIIYLVKCMHLQIIGKLN